MISPERMRPESLRRSPWRGLAGGALVTLCCVVVASATPSHAEGPATTTLVYPPWKHSFGVHRVTQKHLTLRAGHRYRFDNPQGMAALKLQAEDDSTTGRDDDELTVFGVNSGQHMLIFNTSLVSIAFYGRHGNGIGEFDHPTGVAAHRNGRVAVTDTGNNRVHLLLYEDDRLHHQRFLDSRYDGKSLQGPTGIAISAEQIFVCDTGNRRVLVFDLSGALLRSLTPRDDHGLPLLAPTTLAVIGRQDAWNHYQENFLVITDSLQQRLHQCGLDGSNRSTVRTRELPLAKSFDWPAIDYHGSVYVSDRSGRLHKFDHHLQALLTIGRPGTGDYEFEEPRGIGLYRRFGQIFVTEKQGAQYLWTGTDVFSPTLRDVQQQSATVWSGRARFFLTEFAHVWLDLVDASGAAVCNLDERRWTAAGQVERLVQFVPPQTRQPLYLRVTAQPMYSSRTFLNVTRRSTAVQIAPDSSRTGEP